MVILRYTGTCTYRGVDPVAGRLVIAAPGQQVSVSEAKAAQLLHDFPGCWQLVQPVDRRATKPRRRRMRRPSRNK